MSGQIKTETLLTLLVGYHTQGIAAKDIILHNLFHNSILDQFEHFFQTELKIINKTLVICSFAGKFNSFQTPTLPSKASTTLTPTSVVSSATLLVRCPGSFLASFLPVVVIATPPDAVAGVLLLALGLLLYPGLSATTFSPFLLNSFRSGLSMVPYSISSLMASSSL